MKSRTTTTRNMYGNFVMNANKKNTQHLRPYQEIKLSNKGLMLLIIIEIVLMLLLRLVGLPFGIAILPGIILSVSVNNYITTHNEKILRDSKSRK